MIDHESRLHLKTIKIKLSFPQQIVEEHEHVRDTTHPPKHYGRIYVTRSLYEVIFPMSYRNVGSSCPHYRERRRSPHRTDSDALYAVGGGNTGPASSVTTNFTPYYLDKKHRREDTPVLYVVALVYFAFVFCFFPPESLPGGDVLCRLLPRPLSSVCFLPCSFVLFCFVLFLTVFVPDLFWCNFLYLVTTAGFVADQLIM